MKISFHFRAATDDCPEGITVSKSKTLPSGDFEVYEYAWPDCVLWFVVADNFTADQREAIRREYLRSVFLEIKTLARHCAALKGMIRKLEQEQQP